MTCGQRLREVPWRALAGLAPALDAPLTAVLANEPAERVVDRFLRAHRELGSDERRAVKEAIYGLAVWRRRLAWHASSCSPRLLLATLLRDLGGVLDAEALTGLPAGTLPAPRPPPDDPALRYSLPDWLWATLQREAGADAAALADELNVPGPVCLRPNLIRTTPGALTERLAAEGVTTRPGRLVPGALVVTSARPNVYGLTAFREALFEAQDEASQLAGELVAAQPGETVLDLCAGAGGKALQLAAAVAPSGEVHAADPDLARLERLRARAARAGAGAIVRLHGAAPPPELQVDAALVDAPCSELGTLRRGPDRRFHLDPASFDAFPPLQRRLLAAAAGHVRPGGRLVYATCTLRREENEEVAQAFEQEHPAFARDGGFQRTWPQRGGCDGFFVARWRRV